MRRVARRRIVLVTFDAEASGFWLTRDYFPELMTLDRQIMPKLSELAEELIIRRLLPAEREEGTRLTPPP